MKTGIIGFGNLGKALASGLIKSGSTGRGELYICETNPETRATATAEPYYAHASEDVNFVIESSDVIFLTVKSYVFEELSSFIDRRALAGKTIVSFMAGVSFETIYSLIGEVALVRAMPSIAIASCDGVVGYTKASPDVAEILGKLGYAFEAKPEDIEKVMAFSSCGLGFAAYLIDAFASAGQAMGFSHETAARIAAQTFRNAADRGDFRNTVKAVATPGGATEQGVKHMEESRVRNIISDAVGKAYKRMAGGA